MEILYSGPIGLKKKNSLFLIVSLTYLFQFYIFKSEKPRKCQLKENISRGRSMPQGH